MNFVDHGEIAFWTCNGERSRMSGATIIPAQRQSAIAEALRSFLITMRELPQGREK
jgi:hypothetical protein